MPPVAEPSKPAAKRKKPAPAPAPAPAAPVAEAAFIAALAPVFERWLSRVQGLKDVPAAARKAAADVYAGTQKAWADTLKDRKEHGGVLIIGKDGQPYWREGGTASTDANEMKSRFDNDRTLAAGERLLVTAHTHPNSTPPSPEDMANMVPGTEALKLVVTKDAVYVIEKSPDYVPWLAAEASRFGAKSLTPEVAAQLSVKVDGLYEKITPIPLHPKTGQELEDLKKGMETALGGVGQETGLRVSKVTDAGVMDLTLAPVTK
jgi:hypothetical protein